MLWIILGILVSYLIGSIPTAYLFGRALKGIDIRKYGSGNVGATNVLRVLGKGPAVAVLLLDILKGIVPAVFLAEAFAARGTPIDIQTLRVLLGIGSICGHNWTVFLSFKGGKGVATTFGVVLALAIKISALRPVFLILLLTWLIVFLIFRLVSLASILAAIMLPVSMFVFKQSRAMTLAGALLAGFIILRHKSNLQRLFQGKEHRLRFKP
jgi:acyl phosphate:glycerol-3-phosphate acyltransferase